MRKIHILFVLLTFSLFFISCEKNTTVLKIGIDKDMSRVRPETSIIIIEIVKNVSNGKAIWSHEFSINTEKGTVLAELEIKPGEYYIRTIEKKSDGTTIGRYAVSDKFNQIKFKEYNSHYISAIPGGGFSKDALLDESDSPLICSVVNE